MEQSLRNRGISSWIMLMCPITKFDFDMEQVFYQIGVSIGRKPWLWLLASLCVSCVFGPGMLLWREEIDDVELFMPSDSIVRLDAAWVKKHFGDDLRYESIIVTAPNVLEPEVLQKISEIEDSVKRIVVNNNTWQDVCAGYLTWFQDHTLSMSEGDMEYVNKMVEKLNRTTLDDDCIYQSLLKLWRSKGTNDFTEITKQQVLDDVSRALNDTASNDTLLMDVAPLLSRISYDSKGRVNGAKATILHWIMRRSNENLPDWELEFIERVLKPNATLPEGMRIYAVTSRSFKDFLHEVLQNNMTVLFCGLSLIAIYVMAMIGRCNVVQQRIYLSLMGVSVVGQAILSAYGLSYYLGFFYGPIHPILPFLLLGIGVDDMFVVVQSLENISTSKKVDKEEIPKRIGEALRQSGMSITVTSITNIVAFAIGVSTVMPFLKSFCVFATMGILFLYVFEIMFFVSCLVLDERRLVLIKDGCLCRRKSDFIPNDCSQRNTQRLVFEKFFGPLVMKKRTKSLVLLLTLSFLAVNIWGIFHLEQNFDPLWYLNQDSYPIKFNDKLVQYFPKYGKRAAIYLSGVDYYEDSQALKNLVDKLRQNPYVNNRTLEPWFTAYETWLRTSGHAVESKDEYYGYLSEYLFVTKEGQSYVQDVKFNKVPIADYNITISKIQIQHVLINNTSDQIRAMHSVREILGNVNFSRGIENVAVFSQDYVSWTANLIIGEELIHNLSLEILAVGLVTIIILRNLQASIWVICCVLFTLIDLLGSMYYLSLTIEISSSIMILLCAGLAVDYAAHIGLEFSRASGTKDERSIKTLGVIGPAVFNGGLSTFLAFVLMGASDAYLFSTFFKLFTSVVVFGLFHGLVFLPVILSLYGPNQKKKKELETKQDDEKRNCDRDQNGFTTVHLPPVCPDLVIKPTAK
ncbi:patched domain-containing protein 3-like [Venturia canescens]|uniref:patched domain-containing protein 3-like n=1 Tax=Venturia canescens TaxID=32260 RepID=UPI001C9C4777|nr:patched domain-containing protein 3-like [Venturia canescens]XP_043279635.1 patched domain-containing protein 3-like [Venturia canescens]